MISERFVDLMNYLINFTYMSTILFFVGVFAFAWSLAMAWKWIEDLNSK